MVVIEQGRLVVTGAIDAIAKEVRAHNAILMKVQSGSEAGERFLLTQPMVREVQIVERHLGFEFDGDDEQLADLLARAIGEGLRVSEFRHVEASLEEIFLRTTEGKLQ